MTSCQWCTEIETPAHLSHENMAKSTYHWCNTWEFPGNDIFLRHQYDQVVSYLNIWEWQSLARNELLQSQLDSSPADDLWWTPMPGRQRTGFISPWNTMHHNKWLWCHYVGSAWVTKAKLWSVYVETVRAEALMQDMSTNRALSSTLKKRVKRWLAVTRITKIIICFVNLGRSALTAIRTIKTILQSMYQLNLYHLSRESTQMINRT